MNMNMNNNQMGGNNDYAPPVNAVYVDQNITEQQIKPSGGDFGGDINAVDLTQYDPQNSNPRAFGVDIFNPQAQNNQNNQNNENDQINQNNQNNQNNDNNNDQGGQGAQQKSLYGGVGGAGGVGGYSSGKSKYWDQQAQNEFVCNNLYILFCFF